MLLRVCVKHFCIPVRRQQIVIIRTPSSRFLNVCSCFSKHLSFDQRASVIHSWAFFRSVAPLPHASSVALSLSAPMLPRSPAPKPCLFCAHALTRQRHRKRTCLSKHSAEYMFQMPGLLLISFFIKEFPGAGSFV